MENKDLEKEDQLDEPSLENMEAEETLEKEESSEEEINILALNDSTRAYLKDIGSIPLLTFEQEIALTKRIDELKPLIAEFKSVDSNDANDVDMEHYNMLLDADEEYRSCCDKLVEHNMRLVVSIAKHYLNYGLPLVDLIQEGAFGLMKSVEKFEPSKGFKFSTYASWWIRQAVTRAITDTGRGIRLPAHMVESINLMRRKKREFFAENNREPSNAEIAIMMETTEDKIDKIKLADQSLVSLQTPIGDEEDSSLGDFIADNSQKTPDEKAFQNELHKELQNAMECLTDKEKYIIIHRFGLNGESAKTLEVVGKSLNLTRERIRQIESKAIRKLRRPSINNRLKDFRKRI